ncbi:MAG: hypothetical protein K6G19_09255 [Lachnospiraceae bacterium]|nr:hypothetical protein [Lachnospiraceae bacterium]
MYDIEGIQRYIKEHDYSEWSQEKLDAAEAEWSGFPEDSEEYQNLSLLRIQGANKKAEEDLYEAVWGCKKAPEKLDLSDINTGDNPDAIGFAMLNSDMMALVNARLDAAKKRREFRFAEVFEKLFGEYKENHKNEQVSKESICNKARINVYTLNRLLDKNGDLRNNDRIKRDYFWGLAIALELDLEKTEELFSSSGMSIFDRLKNPEENDRELVIRCFIEKRGEWDDGFYTKGRDYLDVINNALEKAELDELSSLVVNEAKQGNHRGNRNKP